MLTGCRRFERMLCPCGSWITRHFHEKAGPCQSFFLGRANRAADCRPTGGTVSPQSFLLGKLFCSAIDTADRRPAGSAQCCRPEFSKSPTRPTSIRTLCGAIAPVPAGCPQLETGAAVSEPLASPRHTTDRTLTRSSTAWQAPPAGGGANLVSVRLNRFEPLGRIRNYRLRWTFH